MADFSTVQEWTVIDCCTCGALFAVPIEVKAKWRSTGKLFYCPNGHSQHYSDSDIKQAKQRAERAEKDAASCHREMANLEEEKKYFRASAASLKGHLRKAKRELQEVPDDR